MKYNTLYNKSSKCSKCNKNEFIIVVDKDTKQISFVCKTCLNVTTTVESIMNFKL